MRARSACLLCACTFLLPRLLCAPHEYDLGILAPGRHQLTVRADNRMSVVPGYRPDGHSVFDALGSTWNGIAGRIELTANSTVWIDDAQVFPNVAKKSALIKVQIGNLTGNVVVQGKWPAQDVPIGKNTALGKVTVDLTKVPAPQEYKLVVGLKGTQFENDWHFWLYPDQVDTVAPSDVLVTADWNAATDRFQPAVTLSPAQTSALWPGPGKMGPSSPPSPQALQGDIIEKPIVPRPGLQ